MIKWNSNIVEWGGVLAGAQAGGKVSSHDHSNTLVYPCPSYQAWLTHVTHFSLVSRVLTQADEVVPRLDAPALVFAWVWRASADDIILLTFVMLCNAVRMELLYYVCKHARHWQYHIIFLCIGTLIWWNMEGLRELKQVNYCKIKQKTICDDIIEICI